MYLILGATVASFALISASFHATTVRKRRNKENGASGDEWVGSRDEKRKDGLISKPAVIFILVLVALILCLRPDLLGISSSTFKSGTQNESQCPADSDLDPSISHNLEGIYGPMGDDFWNGTPGGKTIPNITTPSDAARTLFSQGLIHMYAFNRVEARRNFLSCLARDSQCVMCLWGLAYAYSPSINENETTEDEEKRGRKAIHAAMDILVRRGASAFSSVEHDLVKAMFILYGDEATWQKQGRKSMLKGYSDQLRDVCKKMQHPTCDVLFAEALMKLTPWDYYTRHATSPHEWDFSSLKDNAKEAVDVVKRVLNDNEDHPLALHLWVHLLEASDKAEDSAAAADKLARWPIGPSHLVHMSSHIYFRLGRYEDGIQASLDSIKADNVFYFENCLVPYVPLHNVALMQHCAMMVGKRDLALEYAEPMGSVPPLYSITFNGIFAVPDVLVQSRFGMWDAVLDASPPEIHAPFAQGLWEYSRGLAYAGLGEMDKARAMMMQLRNTTSHVPPSIFPKGHSFYSNYEEMAEMMALVLEARLRMDSSPDVAVEKLSRAAEIQHSLAYIEPETWYTPTKQCLGALLSHHNRVDEAVKVFEEDLYEHPRNGFALKGLRNALRAKHRSSPDAALAERIAKLGQDFDDVWKGANLRINGACCEFGLC